MAPSLALVWPLWPLPNARRLRPDVDRALHPLRFVDLAVQAIGRAGLWRDVEAHALPRRELGLGCEALDLRLMHVLAVVHECHAHLLRQQRDALGVEVVVLGRD